MCIDGRAGEWIVVSDELVDHRHASLTLVSVGCCTFLLRLFRPLSTLASLSIDPAKYALP